MNKSQLDYEIKKLGYPSTLYSLEGELILGTVLDKFIEPGWYRVFIIDDRGNYYDEKKFNSEAAACKYMYHLVLQDARLLPKEIKEKYRNIYFNGHPPPLDE